ncbi:MAG: single-stranded-DNA-specific exonuclease RecJ [Actinomycetia bacterium]|nr:single-stranded-DNA-specific exonuclease RecJ [Actinomycetes bacterium]
MPNWVQRESEKKPENKISQYSPVIYQILANRGISSHKQIQSFLKPSLKNLHNPEKLPHIDKATKRMLEAINNKEKILIFGDYDADGVVSVGLIYNFLKQLGLDVDTYIPSRFDEGYDISLKFVKSLDKQKKYNLLICVDCGTNSRQVIDFVEKGSSSFDVIVCDHHEPTEESDHIQSDRYLIINPKLSPSKYPFRQLSGAGVTFKFIVNMLRRADTPVRNRFGPGYLTQLLDLVAISTVADVMPLVDENRIMVKRGLQVMEKTVNRGLAVLLNEALGKKSNLNTYDIGFVIAPRLNSAGRLETATNSLDILKNDCSGVESKVQSLEGFNRKRKKVQEEILEQILGQKDIEKKIVEQKIFVDKSSHWNEGVLGIVASSLVKQFNVPVILFKEKGDKLKGSGRSIDHFNLYEILSSLNHYFEKFGGHQLACGITMHKDKYPAFSRDLVKLASSLISEKQLQKSLKYDVEISLSQINGQLMSQLILLEPYGPGNPKPVFRSKECMIEDIRYLKQGKHVKLKVSQEGTPKEAIFFRISDRVKDTLSKKKKIDMLYCLQENEWNGNKALQLVILDIF